jgi:hypothetical protein
MKIRTFAFAFLQLAVAIAFSQTPQMKWLRTFSSPSSVLYPECSAALPSGGVVIAGWQQRSWHPWSAVFILAIDSSGNELWRDSIQTVGTTSELYAPMGIAVSTTGEIVFAGDFAGTITASGMTVSDSSYYSGIYIAKYNAGALSSLDMIRNSEFGSLVIDGSGNSWISFATRYTATGFGSSWTSRWLEDMILCKVSPGNHLLWFKQFSCSSLSSNLVLDPNGNMLLFGKFADTLYFDSEHYPDLRTGPYGCDQFVFRIDPAGTILQENISTYGIIIPDQWVFSGGDLIVGAADPNNHGSNTLYGRFDPSFARIWVRSSPYGNGYGDEISLYHIASTEPASFWAFGQTRINYDLSTGDAWNHFELDHYDLNGSLISIDTFLITENWPPFDANAASGNGSMYFSGIFTDSIDIKGQKAYANDRQLFVFNYANALSTGISESNTIDLPEVFPNPSSNIFSLRFDQVPQGDLIMRIYNTLGECVYFRKYKDLLDMSLTIDLGKEKKGIYDLEVISNEKRRTTKLILN